MDAELGRKDLGAWFLWERSGGGLSLKGCESRSFHFECHPPSSCLFWKPRHNPTSLAMHRTLGAFVRISAQKIYPHSKHYPRDKCRSSHSNIQGLAWLFCLLIPHPSGNPQPCSLSLYCPCRFFLAAFLFHHSVLTALFSSSSLILVMRIKPGISKFISYLPVPRHLPCHKFIRIPVKSESRAQIKQPNGSKWVTCLGKIWQPAFVYSTVIRKWLNQY